jgi:tetratricopeptide (TPR) repeat protein
LLVRGRALIHLRQPQYALNDVQEAYARREEPTLFPSAIDPMGTAAETLLAEVFYLNQRLEEAVIWFEKVLQKSSPELRTIMAYTECLDAFGKTAEALEFLHQKALVWKNIPEIWIHGASLLSRHAGLKIVADEWIAEAQLYHPENTQVKWFAGRGV